MLNLEYVDNWYPDEAYYYAGDNDIHYGAVFGGMNLVSDQTMSTIIDGGYVIDY